MGVGVGSPAKGFDKNTGAVAWARPEGGRLLAATSDGGAAIESPSGGLRLLDGFGSVIADIAGAGGHYIRNGQWLKQSGSEARSTIANSLSLANTTWSLVQGSPATGRQAPKPITFENLSTASVLVKIEECDEDPRNPGNGPFRWILPGQSIRDIGVDGAKPPAYPAPGGIRNWYKVTDDITLSIDVNGLPEKLLEGWRIDPDCDFDDTVCIFPFTYSRASGNKKEPEWSDARWDWKYPDPYQGNINERRSVADRNRLLVPHAGGLEKKDRSQLRMWLVVRKVTLIAVALASVTSCMRALPTEITCDKLRQLTVGMEEQSVRRLIGEPVSVHPTADDSNSGGSGVDSVWNYHPLHGSGGGAQRLTVSFVSGRLVALSLEESSFLGERTAGLFYLSSGGGHESQRFKEHFCVARP